MKRATQFIIMVFIIGSFVNIGLSQDTGNPFAGYWKTERGTIIKIEGDQGTCVYTPVISWKEFVGKVVIKNIRQEDDEWIADEFLLPGGKGLWAQIRWDYQDTMIVRQVTFQGKPVLSYYEKTDAFGQETKPIVPMHAFEIGLNLGYFEYEEPDFNVEWDGFMYGVIGSYTYHNKVMLNTSLEYTQGDLDYDGFVQFDGLAPLKEDAEDWIIEWRALLGPDFTSNGHLITPFVGVGYRYWNDDVEGPFSYEREVEYLYTPIGIKTICALSDNWTWGISTEYDLFWGGKVKSHLSDLFYGLNDPEVDQNAGDGYGLRFSLRFNRAFANSSALSIEPYITYWDIDDSDPELLTFLGVPIAIVREPENETLTYGLRIGWQF